MKTEAPITCCARCGTCCRKGGPALHLEDRRLVEEGVIHTRDLYTIRQGEPAVDPILDRLVVAPADIIKIKGRGGTWSCRFFEDDTQRCRIYADRPLECRQLECWNPEAFAARYAQDRLARRDLLAGIQGLWELVEDHHRRCDIPRVRGLLKAAAGSKTGRAARELAQIVAFDGELRNLVVSRGGLEPEMTDFLFGRPLKAMLARLDQA